jgi:two-component system, sensor histidine kinase and response regulator
MNILIIDDVSSSRLMLSKIVKSLVEDVNVIEASCGVEGIEFVEQNPHLDLIILDLGLPDIAGFEVLKLIRESNKKTLISTISDESSQRILGTSIEYGANAYLTKPINKIQIQSLLLQFKITHKHSNENSILVVDDSILNRLLLVKVLQNNGYKTMEAGDGLQAVELAEKNNYIVILMDIHMPNMDGIKATQIIREKDKTTPIIGVTTEDNDQKLKECYDVGFNEIHPKPIFTNVLLTLINKHCKALEMTQ